MKVDSEQLIQQLTEMVHTHLTYSKSLLEISNERLNFKMTPESWSALECIEHLNLVLNFYVPEIDKRISSSLVKSSTFFKGNFIGNKFAKSMLPSENMMKIKTFKKVNPKRSEINKNEVLEKFIEHQNNLLELLEKAKNKNLTKIKTSTLMPLLKLRLGNTFQVVIYHNERHIVQAKNALSKL